MISRKTLVVALSTVIALTAVGHVIQGQSSRNATQPDVAEAVLARLAEIQAAAQALDPDKVFSYVLENDQDALAQNRRIIRTRKEALESTRQGFHGLQKVDYTFDSQHVTLLSPTIALVTGEGSSMAVTADGRTRTVEFAQSVVLVQSDGEWKVLHSHRSFVPQN